MCFAFPLMDGGANAMAICAADTEDALTWTSVSSCTFANLLGCCGMMGTWQCFYGAPDAGSPASTCTSNGGTWQTTSP